MTHPEVREGVRAVCSGFGAGYRRTCDREHRLPQGCHDAGEAYGEQADTATFPATEAAFFAAAGADPRPVRLRHRVRGGRHFTEARLTRRAPLPPGKALR
ncbi:hypothetical protein WHI96_24535 [Pseudonocardia tropica]|uniref:Uncharacterized protein n=1 Tax=Pseudonocardia tropica TaxID=681289 RepID=A0ABV1K193_9PSEU